MNRNVCVSTAVLTAVYCVIVQIRLGTNTLDALVGYLGAMLFVGGVVTVMLLAQRSLRNLEEKNLELEQWIERRTADLHAAQEATEAAAREKVQQKKQILAEEEKPIDEAGAKPADSEGPRSESWAWSKERTVPSKTEAGQIVVEEVLQVLEDMKWPRHEVFGVHLAIAEALANAIKHGNEADSGKKVRVKSSISENLLRVRVTDEGPGFDPATLPDPTAPENLEATTGRGIMVMRNYMDRVEFSQTGNSVILEKDRGEDEK